MTFKISPAERQRIDQRIRERFDIMDDLTRATTTGDCRSMIVSSPAGLGKSFNVEKYMRQWDPTETRYLITKGYVLTTGLIRLLYKYRHHSSVLIFDDADSLFWDENSLNLLKAVCDTTERRIVSYLVEHTMYDEENEEQIPKRFEFDGGIIFLTNIDFDERIAKDKRLGLHLSALISRSHYIDLTLTKKEDLIVRIEQVVEEGLLKYLSTDKQKDVIDFIHDNCDKLRELSLRMAIKLGNIRKIESNERWEKVARVTCCRR